MFENRSSETFAAIGHMPSTDFSYDWYRSVSVSKFLKNDITSTAEFEGHSSPFSIPYKNVVGRMKGSDLTAQSAVFMHAVMRGP